MPQPLSISALCAAILAVVLWGINFPLTKFAMLHFPPVLLMAIRLACAGIVLVFFAKMPTTPKERFHVFALSITQYGINFTLCALGIQLAGAGVASIITLTDVPFSLILAAIILGEKTPLRVVGGVALAMGGAVLVAYPDDVTSTSLRGSLMLLGAAFAYAVSSIQAKQIRLDAFSTMVWASLLAVPQLLVTSYVLEGEQWSLVQTAWTPTHIVTILLMVVASSTAFVLWIRLLRNYTMAQIMPFTLLLPIVGIGGGVMFLGETLTRMTVGGGMAILAGLAMIHRNGTESRAQ